MPKAATNTMYDVLKTHYAGEHIGPGFHSYRIPEKCRDWFIFSVCRNPYSRAVSMWRSTIGPEDSYDIQRMVGSDEFADLMRYLAKNGPWRNVVKPQHAIVGNLPIQRFLRCENLDDEVQTLPFWHGPSPLPVLNTTRQMREHWLRYMTPQIVEWIQAWAGKDFEMFGYRRELPTMENAGPP